MFPSRASKRGKHVFHRRLIGLARAAVVLPGDQPPVPAENRVGCDDAGDLRQNPPAEFLASHRESTALGVGQAKWTWATLLPEDPILLPEIIDHVFLVAVHPARGREYEEAQSVGHSLRLLGKQPLAPTLFRRFANLGRFVAPYGVMYLVAILDWYSRRVLTWRVSNTFDSDFCVEALEDALTHYGPPAIFNTDQGAQFTSQAFTTVLKAHAVAISMDGKGRWVDNVFVERLWRSVKYEDVYLHAYETPASLRAGLTCYFQFYNGRRRHSALGRRTPDVVYFDATSFGTAA